LLLPLPFCELEVDSEALLQMLLEDDGVVEREAEGEGLLADDCDKNAEAVSMEAVGAAEPVRETVPHPEADGHEEEEPESRVDAESESCDDSDRVTDGEKEGEEVLDNVEFMVKVGGGGLVSDGEGDVERVQVAHAETLGDELAQSLADGGAVVDGCEAEAPPDEEGDTAGEAEGGTPLALPLPLPDSETEPLGDADGDPEGRGERELVARTVADEENNGDAEGEGAPLEDCVAARLALPLPLPDSETEPLGDADGDPEGSGERELVARTVAENDGSGDAEGEGAPLEDAVACGDAEAVVSDEPLRLGTLLSVAEEGGEIEGVSGDVAVSENTVVAEAVVAAEGEPAALGVSGEPEGVPDCAPETVALTVEEALVEAHGEGSVDGVSEAAEEPLVVPR
jgi:hypothetical protein